MCPNGLTDLNEIWNQDILSDDASFEWKNFHSKKSDQAARTFKGTKHQHKNNWINWHLKYRYNRLLNLCVLRHFTFNLKRCDEGCFMKNFRFDISCNITQKPHKCLWVCRYVYGDKISNICRQKLYVYVNRKSRFDHLATVSSSTSP